MSATGEQFKANARRIASMVRSGTAHFSTLAHAERYYCSKETVEAKLAEGSIFIGKPTLKPGQTLKVDPDGRYHVESPE